MKKNYLIVMLALVCNFAMAQVQSTSYRGAFAPAPATMWTQGWTNFDPNQANYPAPNVVITADITTNTTWLSTNVYELKGLINVRNNATLTIQPGTVIRSSQVASALVITRGAKLIANGTVSQPIVFTSNKALGARTRGDWGGIVMLGKAKYNINNGVNFIEGLTQTVLSEFGGGLTPDDNDNSGILRYVRIEFAGFVFAPNNELNGLTMGAVGKGTTIENVQVSYSNDDSFEWFGGSVNCKNLVAFAGLDDDFDVDNGYKGIVQFGLSVKDPIAADVSTSEIFEVDNNNGPTDTAASTWANFTSAIFTNITAIGPNKRPNGASSFVSPNSLHDKSARLRRNSRVNIFNSIFLDSRRGLSIESGSSNNAYIGDLAKFKNNTIASPIPFLSDATTATATTLAAITTWFELPANANTPIITSTTTTSAGILTNAYDATVATNYKLIGEAVTATSTATGTIDYRPSSLDATTGASFNDPFLSVLLPVIPVVPIGDAPVVTPTLNYCKGVVAPALTATLTSTGVSLRWFTTAAIPLTAITTDPPATTVDTNVAPFTVAPIPSTSVAGSKLYYVRQVDADGKLGAAATITVVTAPAPALALGSITAVETGTTNAVTLVSSYIGTTTQITYSVPASTETIVLTPGTPAVPVVTSYLWTVPLGVNIISQGAGALGNSIVVNFKNVPAGILTVGNIGVQARNAGLCTGALKILAVKAVRLAAPASVKLTDVNLFRPTVDGALAPIKALTGFGEYMGTTKPLVVTAAPVVGNVNYLFELPKGVNIIHPTAAGTPVTVFYNLYPFVTPLTTRPGTAGNVYYEITTTTYADGSTYATGLIKQNARSASGSGPGAIPEILASTRDLTNLTNEGVAISPIYPVYSTASNVINVNFAGVTNLTAHAYNVTSSTGVVTPTYAVRIGAHASNGVGPSITPNATALNPATTSTAKLLLLRAVAAKAPAAIKMTDADAVDPLKVVTVISKFIGTTKVFTLTATPSLNSSSYQWELPTGVNLRSGALNGSSSNVITVDFAGVGPLTTALYIGVKGVNGIGSSVVTTNVAPNFGSEFKYLKLTSALPAAVSIVAGQIAGVCGGSSYNYSFPASPLANTYTITAPAGSVVTSASNPSNDTSVLSTTDTTFTVLYPTVPVFVATVGAPKTLAVTAVNGVGSSLNKTYTLSTLMPAIGVVTGGATFQRTTSQIFSVPTVVGATSYFWVAFDGASIVGANNGSSVTVDFSSVPALKTTTKLTVFATNTCGISSYIKSITLGQLAARISSTTKGTLTVSTTEVYPNPVSGDYNIDVTASKAGALEISVYSLDGTLIVNPKSVQLQEGTNTITENISDLNSGIYILQLVNSSNNEVITKKLIKN